LLITLIIVRNRQKCARCDANNSIYSQIGAINHRHLFRLKISIQTENEMCQDIAEASEAQLGGKSADRSIDKMQLAYE